jgi:hypothetical protein
MMATWIARILLIVLIAATVVAWSPRYWPVALLHVGLFAAALAWVASEIFHAVPPLRSWLFLPAMVVGSWGAVQLGIGTTVYGFATLKALLYWSANVVAMFVAAQVLRSVRVRRDFLSGLTYFTALIAVVGILQYFTSPYRIYWTFAIPQHVKAIGPFVYRNQFAALVELVLPLALYRAMDDRRMRWVFVVLSAMLVAVVVATASRAGTMLVATEVATVFLLGWRRRLVSGRSLALVFGQMLCVAAVFTLIVGYQDVWTRFQQTNPYALRGKLTRSTAEMIKARPATGFGLGTWQTAYPGYATFDNSLFANEAHNDWAQWTAEGGIPFGVALAALAAGCALLAWRTIWGLGTVFVFAHSTIDYPTREPVIGAILFVLIGAMIATDVQKGRRRSSKQPLESRVDVGSLPVHGHAPGGLRTSETPDDSPAAVAG